MTEFKYIRRAIEPVVLKHAQEFRALVISGPRQAGKSTLAKTLHLQLTSAS